MGRRADLILGAGAVVTAIDARLAFRKQSAEVKILCASRRRAGK